jgi:hypothetical protein
LCLLVTTVKGMPYGYPPVFGPKSGCRNVDDEFMLRSQAALCESTGSLEILVFQTLSAGNIGQFPAPGTVVVITALADFGDRDTVANPETVAEAGAACDAAPLLAAESTCVPTPE